MVKLSTIGLILLSLFSYAQTTPQLLRNDLSIRSFLDQANSTQLVRMAHDDVSGNNFVLSPNGDVFKFFFDGTQNRLSFIGGATQHNINYAQGFAIHNGELFVVGNHKETGQMGYGLVKKAVPNGNGGWNWVSVVTTAPYPSSNALYDHAFSNLIFSLDGSTMYITSGSRTDHGEVQSTEGLYPNTREVALTSAIFKVPANAQNVYLPNDYNSLLTNGYIFARGVRNTFDMAFAPNGDFFGVENCGDRDDPEEINWLVEGSHYGFPWEAGGNLNDQQFSNYNPNNDLLINHICAAWQGGYFYNDPNFPALPSGVTFRQPVKNYGPDADKYRSATTGAIMDASDQNTYIHSFTPHRSPLGLVFDRNYLLQNAYKGKGFMLSYSSGMAGRGGYMQDFNDIGEDLMLLDLQKEASGLNYRMNCYRIAQGFDQPVDAELIGNKLYVVQFTGQIWEITIPMVCQSVNSGNWNDASTWSCGHIPSATDDVTILANHSIALNGADANLKNINLQGSLLLNNGFLLKMH